MSKIDDFVQHYHRKQRAFIWTATADSILQKIARLCSRISKTGHQPALFNLPDAVVSIRANPWRLLPFVAMGIIPA